MKRDLLSVALFVLSNILDWTVLEFNSHSLPSKALQQRSIRNIRGEHADKGIILYCRDQPSPWLQLLMCLGHWHVVVLRS